MLHLLSKISILLLLLCFSCSCKTTGEGVEGQDMDEFWKTLSGKTQVFNFRDIHMPLNVDSETCLKNSGLNKVELEWLIWGHNLKKVLPAGKVPDSVYSRVDGNINREQFCFSSRALLDYSAAYIQKQLENDGSSRRFAIFPEDNDLVCLCDDCRRAGNTARNATPALAKFAETLAKRFRNVDFYIPDYKTTSQIPDYRMADNVGVIITTVNFARRYDPSGNFNNTSSRRFMQRIGDWRQACQKIFIWDYINNFDDYLIPYPILNVMQQRLQLYHKLGIKEIFLNGSGYDHSALHEAYTYILEALTADPYASVDSLSRKFFTAICPHTTDIFCDLVSALETKAMESEADFPMYGSYADGRSLYLTTREMGDFYYKLRRYEKKIKSWGKEGDMIAKTIQGLSYGIMEASRYYDIKENGFLVKGRKDQYKIETLVEDAAETIQYRHYGEKNPIRYVSELHYLLANYASDCSRWLGDQLWKENILFTSPVILYYRNVSNKNTTELTDGVTGFSGSYHWGWLVIPQADPVIKIPSTIAFNSGMISMNFLHDPRHNMMEPKEVEIWSEDKLILRMTPFRNEDGYGIGGIVNFTGTLSIPEAKSLLIKFIPKDENKGMAIDEIYMTVNE